MLTNTTRRRTRNARVSARRAANSRALALLARAGLAARGVMYIIVGLIAIGVAFGHASTKADNSGALRIVGNSPAGSVALWLLAIGFIGLALWRLSEAAFGAAEPGGYKATVRLASLARAIFYGLVAFTIMKFALGLGAPSSTNKQSKDLTATAMHYPGGQVIVGLIGAALVIGGAAYAYSAWKKKFLKRLNFGTASQATRKAVTRVGQVGGMARGAVFATAGIFLMVAAADARPGKAKGVDSALRALAKAPFGPWLLVLVAIGLVLFGIYSWCEARWRAVQ
jgi:Domain of Unknown Function (DUF1206)